MSISMDTSSHSTPCPDQAQQLLRLGLYLNEPEPALICCMCKYAIQTSGDRVSRHLGEKHNISPEQRRGLQTLIRVFKLPKPETIAPRKNDSLPHPHLLILDGFECLLCQFRTTSIELLSRHLSKKHKKGGGGKDWVRDYVRVGLHLQSWTQSGQRQYWTVKQKNDQAGDRDDTFDWTLQQTSMDRLRRVRELRVSEQQRLLSLARGNCDYGITGDSNEKVSDLAAALARPWIRRTGWAEMFQSARKDILLRLSQPPEPVPNRVGYEFGSLNGIPLLSSYNDECKLSRISHAIDLLFGRCEETVRYTDFSILRWLQSYHADRPHKSPFALVLRTASSRVYYSIWKRLIIFYFRLWRLGRARASALFQRPLTSKQAAQLHHIWRILDDSEVLEAAEDINTEPAPSCSLSQDELFLDSEGDWLVDDTKSGDDSCSDRDLDEDEISNSNSSLTSDDYEVDEDEIPRAQGTVPKTCEDAAYDNVLVDSLAQLSVFVVSEEYSNGRAASTLLIYFAGVLGLVDNGDVFQGPGNYTPKLSALVYCSRLIILESTLPVFAHYHAGWPQRLQVDQHECLNVVRRKVLCLGCSAPIDEIISQRNFGRAIARGDGPRFRFEWDRSGDEISWDDHTMTLPQFRQLGRQALATASASCSKLMYDWMPEVRLDKIKDRISNVSKGYSFLYDPENGLQDAYLELMRRACLDPVDGLMTDSRWDRNAVQRYLKLQAHTLEQIMLSCYLLGGQAPRGTELFTIEHRNSSISPRGVYVYRGDIMLVTRYSKARRKNNMEFQVARFLPPAAAKTLFRYLVFVIPFTNMLRRECFGSALEASGLLFENPLRPHEPLATSSLTKALQTLSKDVMETSIGVQAYRQVSIAITERHIVELSKPFDRHRDRGQDANASSIFAWQSGHRPLQRSTTYGLDGAFPDSLQPALIRHYKWASEAWHTFLQISEPLSMESSLGKLQDSPLQAVGKVGKSRSPRPIEKRKRQLHLDERSDSCATKRAKTQPLLALGEEEEEEREEEEEEEESDRDIQSAAFVGSSLPRLDPTYPGPWITQEERDLLGTRVKTQWPGLITLLGQPKILEPSETALEIERILQHCLYQAREGNKKFEYYRRMNFSKRFERWRRAGCQLCFLNTGKLTLGHLLENCQASNHSRRAQEILSWLMGLEIPRSIQGLGNCSLCSGTDHPCREICYCIRMCEAQSESEKGRWREKLESEKTTDGHCENKASIRRAIAALCAYDDQILGKVLIRWLRDIERVDPTAENHIKYWMQKQVMRRDQPIIRYVFLFELLDIAFEFRRTERREHADRKHKPSLEISQVKPLPYTETDILHEWKECLDWWKGRCQFCTSRLLAVEETLHELRRCPRGGAVELEGGLGEFFFGYDELEAERGCPLCGIPKTICAAWLYNQASNEWQHRGKKPGCQYGSIVFEVVVILFQLREDGGFFLDVYEEMANEGKNKNLDLEAVASWIMQEARGFDFSCVNAMPLFAQWTQRLMEKD